MQLLVIRHAIAEDRDRFARTGKDDGLRPLTERGRRRMRVGVRGLRRVSGHLDLLATSPLTRATQTAEIVAAAYSGVKTVEVPQLLPDASVHALLKWLQERKRTSRVAVVGHEPQLSIFVSWLMTGLQESFIRLKKGGACFLEFEDAVRAGRARLVWSLSPAQLRMIAES